MVQGARFLRPFSSEILSLGKSLESVSQSLTQVTSEGARSALASALGLSFLICTMESLCSFVAADPFPSVKWYQAVETTGLPEAGVGLSGFKSSAELLCASVFLSVKWTKRWQLLSRLGALVSTWEVFPEGWVAPPPAPAAALVGPTQPPAPPLLTHRGQHVVQVLLVDEAVSVLVDHVEGLLKLLDLGLVKHCEHIGRGPLWPLLGGLGLGPFTGHLGCRRVGLSCRQRVQMGEPVILGQRSFWPTRTPLGCWRLGLAFMPL